MPQYVDGTGDRPPGQGDGPLLQQARTPASASSRRKPAATILSSSINLTNTILGSGMLAMAAGVATLGLVGGSLLILISGCASALGLYYLTRVAAEIPMLAPLNPQERALDQEEEESVRRQRRKHGREQKASFYQCASATYPRLATIINLAIAVKCFGVAVSYLIIIGDLMPEVIEGLGWDLHSVGLFADRRTWITLGMLIIAPLSFLRKLDSLRYTSLVALTAVVYLVAVVIWSFFWVKKSTMAPGVVLFQWDTNGFLRALPVFVFAFTCHQNVCFFEYFYNVFRYLQFLMN